MAKETAAEKRKKFIEEFLADPDAFKKRWDEETRREYPEMTEEQLQGSWDQMAHQLGL
jgi:hypothetical protein